MNSRQRVQDAVNFVKPDRVPIDLGGIRASGINAVVYDRLKKRMGIDSPTRIHDSMQILPLATPEEVRRHVKHNIDVFSSGSGGFVFTQVHNIQQDVPVENVEAMFQAAYEFGQRDSDGA